jgi:Fe-S-cluster containining protein
MTKDHSTAEQTQESDGPWYRDGLQFECSQCGDCCTGAPGYVWVTAEEIAAIARRLAISVDEMESRFVRKVGTRKTLIDVAERNWDCVFLDANTRGCTIYEDRPRQCRTWPFWHSNVKTPEAWKHTCAVCPGSGQGKVIPLVEIETRLNVVKM